MYVFTCSVCVYMYSISTYVCNNVQHMSDNMSRVAPLAQPEHRKPGCPLTLSSSSVSQSNKQGQCKRPCTVAALAPLCPPLGERAATCCIRYPDSFTAGSS